MTTLDWNKFKDEFGSWAGKIYPFFESGGFDSIYKRLKTDSKRGKIICPLSSDVFRCFRETSPDSMKLIIVGFSPYHTIRDKKPIADGLLMSCSITGKLQPSLENWYNALRDEHFNGESIPKNPDLSYLAKQGVLLFNASLTTEMGKPGNHLNLWEPFVKYFFENMTDTYGVPVLFLGKEAAKYKRWVAPMTWTFEVSHPASAAYSGVKWETGGVFRKIDAVLMNNNGYKIEWFDKNYNIQKNEN